MNNIVDRVLGSLGIDLTLKKRILVIFVMLIILLGTFLLFELDKRTTFNKLVSRNLNEQSIVQNVSIQILEPSTGNRKASVILTDEKIIENVLEDFSTMKLREDRDARQLYRKYRISILTTNERDDILYTESINFSLDEEFLDEYEITNHSDHLKTIQELVDREDIEWITY
ncbi:hypothetical protein [Ferdinandcohnia sp. Marseille-Q9671]